ncbi:hypothetical protein Tco_0689981 [Tanacetum coccineum]
MELYIQEKLQADCDLKATNIVLQGLPPDIYSLVNHHKVTKEIWDKVKLLMQGTSLSKQEQECKLYDEFDKFSHVKGETLYEYYLRFAQLINDINIIQMTMQPVQLCFHHVQDSRVTVQQVQGRQGQNVVISGSQGNASGLRGNTSGQAKVIKCYNYQGEG